MAEKGPFSAEINVEWDLHTFRVNINGGDAMKARNILLLSVFAAMILQACYASNSNNDNDVTEDVLPDNVDADTTDGADTDSTDTPIDDGVTEPDAEEDVPPAHYRLHEWGVTVIEDDGSVSLHGPSPEFSGPIPAKPVIYLYADEEIGPVNVGVNFASGAATEVWPEVPLGPNVVWNNLTIKPGECEMTPFPVPWGDDPIDPPAYCEACALGTCLVDEASCLEFNSGGTTTASRLLFYTGTLPDYEAPLDAEVALVSGPDGGEEVAFSVMNNSSYDIEDVWFIYRVTVDSCIDPSACPVIAADIAYLFIEDMPSGSGTSTTLPVEHYQTEVDEYGFPIGELPLPDEWLDLGKDLYDKLLEKGLTDGEASAFLRNWESIFFGLMGTDSYYIDPFYSNGASIMYFMDNAEYNSQLPLAATPPPIETVRVGMVYEKLFVYYTL